MSLGTDSAVLLLGATVGTVYGLLAIGLVLVYRLDGVINFAHASMGVLAATFLSVMVTRWHVPYLVALWPSLALGAALGLALEAGVIRKVAHTPTIMKIVATIGAAAVLDAVTANLSGSSGFVTYPQPPGLPQLRVGPLLLTHAHVAMLVGAPLVVAGLGAFFRFTRTGVAIRASAANGETARLSGVPAVRLKGVAWALAGGLAAFTAVLVLPTGTLAAGGDSSYSFLLRALVAAVVARMTSLPVALMAGIGVGILEEELFFHTGLGPGVDMVLLGVLLLVLLFRRRGASSRAETADWLSLQAWRPLPDSARGHWLVRHGRWVVFGTGAAAALVLPGLLTQSATVVMTSIVAFSIVGISLGIISGLAGQISLGQFAVAGAGAVVAWAVSSASHNFILSLGAAAAVGGAFSVVLGIPSVRIKGLMFAVATLAFAQATPWALQQGGLLGRGRQMGALHLLGLSLADPKSYYFVALAVLGLAMLTARRVWASAVGRRYRAVRDNEDGARAFAVPALRVKLEAFAVAGALAGAGGAIFAHNLTVVSPEAFPLSSSIDVVAMASLGGLSILSGPILGALYIIGIPRFLPLDQAGVAATSLGWLLIVLNYPGGLAQALGPLRDRLVARLATTDGAVTASTAGAPALSVADAGRGITGVAGHSNGSQSRPPTPVLEAKGLTKRYGGLLAVDDVTLDLHDGEILGLIGPNGAGKTTLFELLGGFTRPDAGSVALNGVDMTAAGPEARSRAGLCRSFQDARLFPTLTVREAVELAGERRWPTPPVRTLAGLSAQGRRQRAEADQVIDLLGLGRYRDNQIAELSTGTRRVVELGCVLALQPSVLLLDEPSSGIAQRETEALAGLLRSIQAALGASVVIIEHDIPMIRTVSDRVVAMVAGKVIASGPAEETLSDPQVVDAYLGMDVTAVERSDAGRAGPPGQLPASNGPDTETDRCAALTRSGARCARPATDDGYCYQHGRTLAGAAR